MARYCESCGHAEDQHDYKVGCVEVIGNGGECCPCSSFVSRDLKIVTHAEVVSELEQQAAERRTTPALAVPPVITLPGPPLTVTRITLAGKQRAFTEIEAAANAIIAETNAEDLADGVAMMRRQIAELQAAANVARRTISELRQQLRDATKVHE